MKPLLPLTIDIAFILAWAFPIVMAVLYRAYGVPRRLTEIEDVFVGPPENGQDTPLKAMPGCHYLTLFRSLKYKDTWTRESLMTHFRRHFYAWHSWKRYLLPLSFIFVISAIELRFCRDWTVVQLERHAKPDSSVAAGSEAASIAGRAETDLASDSSAEGRTPTPPNRQGTAGTAAAQPRKPDRPGPLGELSWIRSLTREQMAGVPDAVILALLGAFVWSVYEILSRRYSRDLTPQELLEITFRLIAAIPIGYAFSQLAADKWDAPLAFAASALPVRDLRRLIRERGLAKASAVPGSERLPTAHLGQVVDGISNETAARLEELNITTAWDLAYVDPVALMARTGYSLRLILAWMDQALLVVYFDGKKTVLGNLAIPCALDLCEFYEKHCMDPATGKPKSCDEDNAVKDLAAKLDIPATILPERLCSLCIDPHLRFLAACWYPEGGSDSPAPGVT